MQAMDGPTQTPVFLGAYTYLLKPRNLLQTAVCPNLQQWAYSFSLRASTLMYHASSAGRVDEREATHFLVGKLIGNTWVLTRSTMLA